MPKVATKYLDVDPWIISETGLHQDRTLVSESVFSLGNEFMGARGYFEEGYGGETMLGSFFNGIYEEQPVNNFFKGLIRRTHFIVNAIDWLYTRISVDDEQLDLAKSRFRDFKRTLDMREGILQREFTWMTKRGQIKLVFERFTSMLDTNLGCQRISFESIDFRGAVKIEIGLDANTVCETQGRKNFFGKVKSGRDRGGITALLAQMESSKQHVMAAMRLVISGKSAGRKDVTRERYAGTMFNFMLKPGAVARVDRMVACVKEQNGKVATPMVWKRGLAAARKRTGATWESAKAAHISYWTRQWCKLDVKIDGDPDNQQGVRFGIFQLHQTYHGSDSRNNIAAKGLTGEAYAGLTWWDTETYCLPFYMFNNPQAARNLLSYRYRVLPQACERARQKDCEGARYPMCSIDGTEACGTWQHGDLEIHVPAAVAYGIWHYVHVTNDREFLYNEGLEMLLQISRYYASRGQWSQKTGDYGFWFVMGPDEFHMGVNNNCYTNFMAKKVFEWTLDTVREMKRKAPAQLAKVLKKVAIRRGEFDDWKRKSRAMRILKDPKTGIYEQHDGYFDTPHLDCSKIAPTDFPLYHHWAYFRLFRWDMIKQPDVLLLHFFFSHEFDDKNKLANFMYYEPRCSHESSLSPGIHSILAAELGLHKKAYSYWGHAARLDLDNYNRNTNEGLHTTSMAAAWMNVVYGFGGMRSDGPVLSFKPVLPARWKMFSFSTLYRGTVLSITIDRKQVFARVTEGTAVDVDIFGKRYKVGRSGAVAPMPAARIAGK